MNSRTLIATAVLSLLAGAASASTNEYTPLFKAEKYAEIERLANSRLAQDPRNFDALIAKSDALVALGPDHFDDAVKVAEQCAAAHPTKAECQEAIGSALGAKAMTGGMMAAMGSVGKIKDAFKKAVEIDPKSVSARYALMQFYVMAPGIAGGSTSKAKEIAAETAQFSPEAGKLMQAQLELADDKFAKAEAVALSVNAGGNDFLVKQQRSMMSSIGFKYLAEKKYSDCDRLFQEVQKRFPEHDIGLYGQARVLQETGKHAAAISLLDKANSLAAAPHSINYFRLGQSFQATGDKAKAVAAYEKALSIKAGMSKKQSDDATAQLKVLKS
jgi:tetratricopeptide (TPR) repeat protein